MHKLAAMFFKSPFIEISLDEAKKLAHAAKNVLALHNINVSPATLAYIQLVGVLAAIYGPRFAMYQMHLKMVQEQAKQKAANPEPTPDAMQNHMGVINPTIQ